MDDDFTGDYLHLLSALIATGEAVKGKPLDPERRLADAEALCRKFLGHACSAFDLAQGTSIAPLGISFVDPASINVVCRAAFETFLVLHYIFVEPGSDEQREYRHLAWLHAGLLERQSFPARDPENKRKLEEEKRVIDHLRKRLEANPCYQALKPKQKRAVIMDGRWRDPGWKKIALSAGLSQMHAETMYSFLCGYAHSSYLSAMQVGQARTRGDQELLIGGTLRLLMYVIAFMVNAYLKLLRLSDSVLTKDQQRVVLMYSQLGACRMGNDTGE